MRIQNSPIISSHQQQKSVVAAQSPQPDAPAAALPEDQVKLAELETGTSLAQLKLQASNDREQRLQHYYGTAESESIQQQARETLGITGPGLSQEQRSQNFKAFAQRFFPQASPDDDPFEIHYYGPAPDSRLYALFETYAHTDYGSKMLEKVLNEAGDKPFAIKVIPNTAPQSWKDHISYPPSFPPENGKFKISGQAIDPLAILHHEFEHTRFGQYDQGDQAHDILHDELIAVRDVENPGAGPQCYEPRYTYTQMSPTGEALQTFSILKPEAPKAGAWVFDPTDPRQLIPKD